MDVEYLVVQFAKGLKTLVAGGLLMGAGGYGLYSGKIETESAVGMIAGGMGVWGIGGKIERNTKAVKDAAKCSR